MYQIALFLHILGVLCLMGGHTLIHASLALFLVMMILGPVLLGRRFAALNNLVKATPPGTIQAPLAAQMRDRTLWTIENTFTSLLLAILFLMTVKPNLLGTGIVVSIGLVVGLLSTVRMRRVAPPAALSSSIQERL
jgi:hypothetical protein